MSRLQRLGRCGCSTGVDQHLGKRHVTRCAAGHRNLSSRVNPLYASRAPAVRAVGISYMTREQRLAQRRGGGARHNAQG